MPGAFSDSPRLIAPIVITTSAGASVAIVVTSVVDGGVGVVVAATAVSVLTVGIVGHALESRTGVVTTAVRRLNLQSPGGA